ncbi:hypothetical protein [Mycobacterium sp. 155]|uniref:hypothetical protein n=1 Tax=Mycobacterium sp. 155 TaxID=1157943 RepID=UPI00036F5630|nr:hypothetical protein [Mycobacterium sp. 155]
MSVGRGWAQIEADLRAELAAIGVTHVSTYEKYGWMRAEVSPWTPQAQAICDRAEERSATVCEVCGVSPAERHRRPNGWIKTLCGRHASSPLVRYRPGWQQRVDQLVDELAEVDPGARVQMVSASRLGPQAVFTTTTDAGRDAVFAALNELRSTCGGCGRVQENETEWRAEFWCAACKKRK